MFQTIVSGLTKAGNGLAMAANVVGTLTVLVLVVIVNYDVVARGVFSAPLHGAYELVQFSIVFIVFLQLPDVVRVDRLTRSDGFLLLMDSKRPRFAAVLRRVIHAMSAFFMAMIAIIMFPEFLKMLETRDYFGVPGVFTAPWWPIKLVIASSATLCSVLFILKILNRRETTE